ncbi:PREDICTED: fibroblast growth factor receptor 1-like [Acropora digitifera]|uniref:fibroblast growth factor receptor 1-like n=1 Tax=Acropora digitifera TaxID=70779 RepID=UPI00077A2219|nr:PREDICTED: fibroblast growth factor receptor 1-like [Acropora digitifera]
MRRRPVRVNLGETWNATCKARGNPAPRIEWRKKNSNHTLRTTQHGNKGVELKIDTLAEEDLGIYLCVAENSVGKDNASIELVSDNPDIQQSSQTVSPTLDTNIVIGISVVTGAVFCSLVLAISIILYIRHQKKQILKHGHQLFLKHFVTPQLDPHLSLHEQRDRLPYDPFWEFPEDRLTLGEALGSGCFAQVIKAEAMGIAEFNSRNKRREKVQRRSILFRRHSSSKRYVEAKLPKTTVAVKTLKGKFGSGERAKWGKAKKGREIEHVGKHKNIVNFLGACTKGERLLVIIEYAPYGNLGDFLRSHRYMFKPVWGKSSALNPELEFNISHLVNFSYQVCRGMEFLASKKCIHRDLAARNVLVGEEYVMKIADFGFARDIYATDEYVKTTGGVFPVKWMALESLFSRVYSEKSDVWSFGICLWEIFTLGGTPYHRIGTECLVDFLSEGNRMESPQGCPEEFYTIMQDCWRKETKDRPSFAELSEQIGR